MVQRRLVRITSKIIITLAKSIMRFLEEFFKYFFMAIIILGGGRRRLVVLANLPKLPLTEEVDLNIYNGTPKMLNYILYKIGFTFFG
jgi:hypothetical protein